MDPKDEVTGVFDAIDTESTAHDPVEEVSTEAKAEGGESEATEETKTEQTEETEATGQSEEGQSQTTEESTNEPSKTETETSSQEQNTKTESENKTEQDITDWKKELPPPPPEYQGKQPEFNEEGQIVNMTPQEYLDYTIAKSKEANQKDNYNNLVESKAFEVAEQIIPEMKTNKNISEMVRNTRLASIVSGNPIDTVEAAIRVRELLGIAPEKLEAAKSEGASQTKASIEIQKNAALETGATNTRDEKAAKEVELTNRIRRGDDDAFAELLGSWEAEGKL